MKANPTYRPDEQKFVQAESLEENGKEYIPTDRPGVYSVKFKERKPDKPIELATSDELEPENEPEKHHVANVLKYSNRAKGRSKKDSAQGKKKRISGFEEWTESKNNVNFCTGCENDCIYCYMKPMADRNPRWKITSATWHQMRIRQQDVDKKQRLRNGTV